MSIMEIKQVGYSYDNEKKVLKGVNAEMDQAKCTGCCQCQRSCKFNIPVHERPNSPDCIRCGDCRRACPHGAICHTFSRRQGETPTGAAS